MTPKKVELLKQLLLKQYGRPAKCYPSDPIDQLVATILSQNTSDINSERAFECKCFAQEGFSSPRNQAK